MNNTSKRARFIEEYLLDRNATQAAIRAGYSQRTAGVQGHDLLKKPYIRRAVAVRAARQAAELKITREQVILSLVEAYELAKSKGDAGAMIKAAAELCGFYDKPVAQDAGAASAPQWRINPSLFAIQYPLP